MSYGDHPPQQPYGDQTESFGQSLPPGPGNPGSYGVVPFQTPPPPQRPPMQVHPKSPMGAMAWSFFIPGVGSMVAGNASIGWMILCMYIVSWLLGFLLIFPFFIAFGIWIWGLVNAHGSAVAWNLKHGIMS